MNLNFLVAGTSEQIGNKTHVAPLATDGIQGPKTRKAAALYQWRHNTLNEGGSAAELRETGRVDSATRDSLRADVRNVQQQLLKLGYDLGRWGADGVAGKCTQAALRKFQQENELPVTGRLDEATAIELIGRSALHTNQAPAGTNAPVPTETEAEAENPVPGQQREEIAPPPGNIEA
jgi:peptidoglycan hydrolase-like protein with peptidoglycan-binding domain